MAGSCRIVISGIGTISPVGIGNRTFWDNLIHGRSGVGFLESVPGNAFPSRIAAEIRDFDPLQHVYCRKFLKIMSRDIQLGASAAAMAMQDSGLEPGQIDPDRLGVTFGSGRISTRPEDLVEAASASTSPDSAFENTRWGEDSMGRIAPLWLLKRLPNMPACHIAIQHDARGPNNTITSRDASALLALAEGFRVIERGAADAMIVGACSSNIHPVDLTKFHLFEDLSKRDEDPQSACRPFDATRDGTIVGEGSAAFVIERLEHAVRRGAPIYAEVLGVGAGCDGASLAQGAGGRGISHAVKSAMRRAEIQPREIGHINAHGKSTQLDDCDEARGYHWSLGDEAQKIPVTALKSYFGHFDGGSGAVELAGSLLALKHRELPATLNYRVPDPRCRLNVAPEPQPLKNLTAMSVNRTAMGQSAAAIIRAM
ncbi:MAG: beta-ketoacyl-[acyl-carrier-protein] synthase family protein [Planctomycetes bacterium]|nr:beta-ketoacyl-[acyl-carrier-protein] synthase family protein [Planctomycetota bacterium]